MSLNTKICPIFLVPYYNNKKLNKITVKISRVEGVNFREDDAAGKTNKPPMWGGGGRLLKPNLPRCKDFLLYYIIMYY
jgi:hypothetical protein